MAINVTTVAKTIKVHLERAERSHDGSYPTLKATAVEIACEAHTYEGCRRFLRLCGLDHLTDEYLRPIYDIHQS